MIVDPIVGSERRWVGLSWLYTQLVVTNKRYVSRSKLDAGMLEFNEREKVGWGFLLLLPPFYF